VSKRQNHADLRTHPLQIVTAGPNEEWRPIADYEGYFVSNMGRVCSVDRYVPRSSSPQFCRGRLLRPGPQMTGHLTVSLMRYNSKQVHVLVLNAFVGSCPDGCEGLHWDDDPSNNALSNLRWGTRAENIQDALRNGGKLIGERIRHAKLTDERVRWIRANSQYSMNSLAGMLGVSCAAVKQVLDGVTWKHVK
jgi:hypothetical protein